MGKLEGIARFCAERVAVPLSAGCCAFAGDRGFLFPELTASATRHEAAELKAAGCAEHVSSSRTCEIGMTRATGAVYRSFVHLVERATRGRGDAGALRGGRSNSRTAARRGGEADGGRLAGYIGGEVSAVPEVSRFYGIIIKIFFGDHPPPHFHAVYGEYVGVYSIESLELIEGDLPERARRLVTEWAALYQQDLLAMWRTQEFRKLPPLK